jgi:hypothetical protein
MGQNRSLVTRRPVAVAAIVIGGGLGVLASPAAADVGPAAQRCFDVAGRPLDRSVPQRRHPDGDRHLRRRRPDEPILLDRGVEVVDRSSRSRCDVAAYLCGAGSLVACDVLDRIATIFDSASS